MVASVIVRTLSLDFGTGQAKHGLEKNEAALFSPERISKTISVMV